MNKARTRSKLTRRQFLAGALTGTIGTLAYMRWVEPRWLGIGRHQVQLGPQPGPPIRLLQMSDLHASDEVPLEFIQSAVTRGLEFKPDLICLTGDFITGRYNAFARYAEILKPLADTAPTFATLGNHDGGRWVGAAGYRNTQSVRDLLSQSRIELLHNRATSLRVQGRQLNLVGVGDLWAGELDASAAFSGQREEGTATILLSHNPDSKEEVLGHRWDLMLSGHTHGGQCDLVFLGTPFAPVRDKRYVRGLHRWNDRWIHVTKGVGSLHGMRLNCRPEVSFLTIG